MAGSSGEGAPPGEAEVARLLASLSSEEIVAAVGAGGASGVVRKLVELAARRPSRRLGRTLARFDDLVERMGVVKAARVVLRAFGAGLALDGAPPSRGPLLVVTNHPGAYDALAMMVALGREDVALVAADRAFLRAMPSLCAHLVFIDDASAFGRVAGMRRALAWLSEGRALVQFGAGAIEPDARFAKAAGSAGAGGSAVPGAWAPGTGVLAARASALGAAVVPAFVAGVHSARAMRLPIVRWAERRGITTVAPLIQATMPGFRDVSITVRIGAPLSRPSLTAPMTHEERAELLRSAVAALGSR